METNIQIEKFNISNNNRNDQINQFNNESELPTSIIIKDVPEELFQSGSQIRENFIALFRQITDASDSEHPSGPSQFRVDFLKSFRRVRVVFNKPEHATAAKLLIEHHSFNGVKMKTFFSKNIKMSRCSYQDDEGYLKLPPLEKQFLISPPTSPPVGWVQHAEMVPVICDFDLMARLAAFTLDDRYELYEGDANQPSIIVTPCQQTGLASTTATEIDNSENGLDQNSDDSDLDFISNSEQRSGQATPCCKARPRTPRPPLPQ